MKGGAPPPMSRSLRSEVRSIAGQQPLRNLLSHGSHVVRQATTNADPAHAERCEAGNVWRSGSQQYVDGAVQRADEGGDRVGIGQPDGVDAVGSRRGVGSATRQNVLQ